MTVPGDASVRGMMAVNVAAQAKINLRLRILAREITGLHQLETLFLRIGLSDTVTLRRIDGPMSLDLGGDVDLGSIGAVEKNLAWRAAQAYFVAADERWSIAIEIEKRIPIGGGLGGGSADAAAVLRGLEAMSSSPIGERRLLAVAASLGSDVAFLASAATYALAWGRGERMMVLEPPSTRSVLLVVPSFAVNTAEAYGWLAADRAALAETSLCPATFAPAALSDWDAIRDLAVNDFEPPVAARYPDLAGVLHSLRRSEDVALALMTGSGSTAVAIGCAGKVIERVIAPESGSYVVREIVTQTSSRVEPVTAIE